MKKELLQLIHIFQNWRRTYHITCATEFKQERENAEIIRLVHSIEKGLSLENPRLGFGVKKINELFDRCEAYCKIFGNNGFCLKMAYDAIAEYITFHQKKDYIHEDFTKICHRFEAFPYQYSKEKHGGTLYIDITEGVLSFEQLSDFLTSRHSVRDFSDESISDEELYEAVRLAQTAPSACNRQAVRAYVLSSENLRLLYKDNMAGIGGFAEAADKFILITGKVSAYRMSEYNQYIVSASIFASYLMLALHAKNIGSCIVQRPLQYSKQWKSMLQKYSIPEDEQLVLMLAIGKNKESYTVPVSKRYPTEDILKILD